MDEDSGAFWPEMLVGEDPVDGECLRGYNGTPSRMCTSTTSAPGTWGEVLVGCEPMFCEAVDDSEEPGITASFPRTLAGSLAIGACAEPLHGRPYRRCNENGTWEDGVLYNPCAFELCPALENDGNAEWPSENVPGVEKDGSCLSGYAGTPKRLCGILGWQEITSGCERTFAHRFPRNQALVPR